MEDMQIVELYWQRSQDAISWTQRKYGSYLTQVAYNILHDREDSQESVNDTYLAAWNAMPPHRPTLLCAFLSKLTRRISIDLLRRRTGLKRGGGEYPLSLQELEECVGGGEDPARQAEAEDLARAIGRFLGTLPEKQRHVFLGRYFYLDPVREVARYCGVSESNAKVLLHRTRQALRDYLAKEGYL